MVEDRQITTAFGSPKRSDTRTRASVCWKRILEDKGSSSHNASLHDVPSPRSGHAMTYIESNGCMLLFGGSDGKVFFEDFYLLVPNQVVVQDERTYEPEPEHHSDQHRTFQWKKMVVCHATLPLSTDIATSLSNSFGSQNGNNSSGTVILPNGGAGRDYHSMHYIPPTTHETNEERRRGARVLVLGNVMVSSSEHDEVDNESHMFDMEEMRVEEVRIRESVVEAQWIPTRFRSMWKPRARVAHSSVLVGDQLFVFGGKNATATAYYNDLCYFDIALNQWRNPPSHGSIPAPRAFADMAVSYSHENLFLYGGFDGKQQFGGMYMYDIASCRWDKIVARGEKPATRMNSSLTFVSPHHLLIFGGRQKSVRQNDLYLFDIETSTWKQLASSHPPIGRTAHTAVHYLSQTKHPSIIIFGGYAGSHQWLNDLYALEIDPHELSDVSATPIMRKDQRSKRDLPARPSSSSTCLSSQRTNSISVLQSHSLPRSATTRVESPLHDITNQPLSTSRQLSTTTPPIASRSLSPTRMTSTRLTSPIQIYNDYEKTLKRRKSDTGEAVPSTIQSTLMQLLQHQLDMEQNLRHVSDLIANDQLKRQHEEAASDSTLQQLLEHMIQRCEAAENKLGIAESEKLSLQQQLVAAEAGLHAQQRAMDEWLPTLGSHVVTSIERVAAHQSTANSLIQAKIAAVHAALEELRHYSEESTEPDEYKDSIYPVERRRSSSPKRHVFPHIIIRDLQHKLQSSLKTNQALETKVMMLEDKLKRAEMNSQRIQQLAVAWMQQIEEEEKQESSHKT